MMKFMNFAVTDSMGAAMAILSAMTEIYLPDQTKDHTEDIFGPPLTDAMVKVQRWNQIPRSPDGGFQLQ